MILISACLLGCACRYDGKSKPHPLAQELARQGLAVPVCPEQLGGLPTPREPAEIVGGDGRDVLNGRARVMDRQGRDVTAAFVQGAEKALAEMQKCGVTHAVLKGKSPSCGTAVIYDGSFSGTLKPGNGVFAQKLVNEGIPVYTEEDEWPFY